MRVDTSVQLSAQPLDRAMLKKALAESDPHLLLIILVQLTRDTELWGDDDPQAFLGITVPGFPNFFVMYGPNTNLAHASTLFSTANVRPTISYRLCAT